MHVGFKDVHQGILVYAQNLHRDLGCFAEYTWEVKERVQCAFVWNMMRKHLQPQSRRVHPQYSALAGKGRAREHQSLFPVHR